MFFTELVRPAEQKAVIVIVRSELLVSCASP